MTPHYEAAGVTLFHGDCLDVLRDLPDESIHAVVTDPPYGLSNTDPGHVSEAITHWSNGDRAFLPSAGGGFMGKAWDEFVPPPAVWDECMRVLKPGGHLLAFAGSRTVDLMALSIRLAGFDIRDSIAWLYGSGFPKSMDVAKAVDKIVEVVVHSKCGSPVSFDPDDISSDATDLDPEERNGYECACLKCDEDLWLSETHKVSGESLRQIVGAGTAGAGFNSVKGFGAGTTTLGGEASQEWDVTSAGSADARAWEGWGTALKPSFEPIVVARKPIVGTVAKTVLAHGTGALNIDATRVHTEGSEGQAYTVKRLKPGATLNREGGNWRPDGDDAETFEGRTKDGRHTPNVVLDDSQASALDEQTGVLTSGVLAAHHARAPKETGILGAFGSVEGERGYGDSGGASRFFPTFRYEAKAPTSERPVVDGVAHPTVKPLELMQWLVRLVTPKGGVVLEPFAGSGTTVEACLREGFDVIAIEREADYLPLIEKRIRKDHAQGLDFDWGAAS